MTRDTELWGAEATLCSDPQCCGILVCVTEEKGCVIKYI